jgi:D-arabinitol 2-dehydrogenase
MDKKVCVITGAGRGLGNMVARTFVESGASAVALIDLKKEDAESAAKDLVDWFGTSSPQPVVLTEVSVCT